MVGVLTHAADGLCHLCLGQGPRLQSNSSGLGLCMKSGKLSLHLALLLLQSSCECCYTSGLCTTGDRFVDAAMSVQQAVFPELRLSQSFVFYVPGLWPQQLQDLVQETLQDWMLLGRPLCGDLYVMHGLCPSTAGPCISTTPASTRW